MTAPVPPAPPASQPSTARFPLQHMPVPLFASVMGLGGLALAWQRTVPVLGWSALPGQMLTALALAVFVLLLALYAGKLLRHPAAVRQEFAQPLRKPFFPAITISLLLLAIALAPFMPALAAALWWLGALGHLLLTLNVLNHWLTSTTLEPAHVTPAWFIPVVGNIVAPIAGVKFGGLELAWFFFSVGFVFWLVLLTMVLDRLFFHAPLPPRMQPTLAILMAPPAVGCLAVLALSGGEPGVFARILYDCAVFFALLLLLRVPDLRRLPFALSWWAYSFPCAALTLSTLSMAHGLDSSVLRGAGIVLLGFTTVLIAVLFWRTLRAALAGKVFAPE